MFFDQDILKNETGEIIAARYNVDDQWYRARVINNARDGKTKVITEYTEHVLYL